jgi:hypothetical protein
VLLPQDAPLEVDHSALHREVKEQSLLSSLLSFFLSTFKYITGVSKKYGCLPAEKEIGTEYRNGRNISFSLYAYIIMGR